MTLGCDESLDRHRGLFISAVSNSERGKYSFVCKRSDAGLAKETLRLPVDGRGRPDWGFMDRFSREREDALVQNCLNYHYNSRNN